MGKRRSGRGIRRGRSGSSRPRRCRERRRRGRRKGGVFLFSGWHAAAQAPYESPKEGRSCFKDEYCFLYWKSESEGEAREKGKEEERAFFFSLSLPPPPSPSISTIQLPYRSPSTTRCQARGPTEGRSPSEWPWSRRST